MGLEQMDEEIPSRLCGRPFAEADLEKIRHEIAAANPPLRAEIARRVCRALDWTDVLGRPKLMSARVGLLRLHRAGLIELPAPSRGNGNARGLVRGPDRWPEPAAVVGTVGELSGLRDGGWHLATVPRAFPVRRHGNRQRGRKNARVESAHFGVGTRSGLFWTRSARRTRD